MTDATDPTPVDTGPIEAVAAALADRIATLPPDRAHRAVFLATYRRTTLAVRDAVRAGSFEDPAWVVRWDACFAGHYLAAHDADLAGDVAGVPRPWRLAFAAPADLVPLRHVLLGINAHVNFDLPQAVLEVVPPEDVDDPVLLGRRRRDHARIDDVLASRVAAEDAALGGPRRLRDRALTPLNRAASTRFLREARAKVWHNVGELDVARRVDDATYRARRAELEVLAAARIADLLAPGQVLLRLAVAGFGVVLPPA